MLIFTDNVLVFMHFIIKKHTVSNSSWVFTSEHVNLRKFMRNEVYRVVESDSDLS